jgi:galactose oxidase-like protein/PKD domain-containing protein
MLPSFQALGRGAELSLLDLHPLVGSNHTNINVSGAFAQEMTVFAPICHSPLGLFGRTRRTALLWAGAFLALLLLALVPPAQGQAAQGKWQTLPTLMPINPVHAALLHNGQILIVSGSGNVAGNTNFQAGIFDPASGNVTTMPVTWDMFCNAMVVLPDGRVFVDGGTLQYDPFHGELRSSVYDLATGQFTDVQSMANGRWYPTVTSLADGTVMTFSGLTETGGTNSTVEIYTVGSGWSVQYGSPFTPPLYPRMHLIPNGKVFYSGSGTNSRYFDPSTHTWSGVVANTVSSITRTYGSSVLLPLSPANNYKPIVMIMGGGNPSTNTTERIDLSAASPKWVSGTNLSPNMSQPRTEMNATILPNGKVIALGGSLNDEDTSTASLNADLYDPVANTFSSAGQNAFARLYHSVSLLLPDGTVWLAGGNPARGSYENHIEIYSPAYLFKSDGTLATRPVISSVPASVGYGAVFQVQTPDAATISSIALVRPGAVTHAFDMEQRLVNLSFTAGSGVLNVTAPPNGNIAPPGYYMLFILNSSGVPSVGRFVQVNSTPADIPPTGTITNPPSNVTITAGQSVFFSGSGSDPDGTISGYSWTLPGGSPSSSALATPGNVIYATPGTYTATFTVTDNANVTDPNPPTRTITVNSSSGLLTPALVQHASLDAGGTTSSQLAFAANNTPGNWIGVAVRSGKSGQTFTVSDSRGNAYHPAVQFNQTLDSPLGETLALFYAENIAGGANTITISQSASATLRFAIVEYSGVATTSSLDVTAAAQGSGTSLSSGSATSTANGDLILGLVATADGVTYTAGTGFAIEERVPAAPNTKLIVEDTVQAAAGPISVSASLSSSNNGGAVLAAFRHR